MNPSPPSTLGKYQVIREIARSNDIVYEGYDPLMNRRVAIKELAIPTGVTGPQRDDRVRRFQREVKAAGSLAHPNIVTIYEVGEEGGRHFMAMEFLDGRTLRNEIDTRGFLPQDRAIEIALDVLSALAYAHDHGVIHRDVKPENVQLLEDGRVKLTDFGIARLTFEPNITVDGQVFGTPSYMSPEQVIGKEIDARSDLFSVGILLYEMVAGQKPFQGDSVVSLTYSIMNTEPEQPTAMSYPLWQVVHQALQKTPVLRQGSANELSAQLESVRTALQQPVVAFDPSPSPPTMMGPNYPPVLPMMPAPPPLAAPIQTPYMPGGPMMPTQVPLSYNPYAVPMQPPYPQAPTYYPPPPRQPLMKPETRQFLGKFVASILIIGALFALLIAGIKSVSTALERYRVESRDTVVVQRLQHQTGAMDYPARIREATIALGEVKSESARGQIRHFLAALYEQQGNMLMNAGRAADAEASYRSGLANDPDNPALYSDLAALYSRSAQSSRDRNEANAFWQESARNWTLAAQNEEDLTVRGKYENNAKTAATNAGVSLQTVQKDAERDRTANTPETDSAAYSTKTAESKYTEALVLLNENDLMGARMKLFEARRFAPPNSDIAHNIEEQLDALRNKD